jgi:hypothetical protein
LNIIVRYQDMPCRVKAFSTANIDGTYTVVLNSLHTYLALRRAFAHEIQHIHGGDLENIEDHCDLLEAMVRNQRLEVG